MTIDALIEMSRNEGLWVDDEDRNYGFCQCKVSMTGDVVWIAEFDGEIWYVFQSFDTDTPMLSLETVECGTVAELAARLKGSEAVQFPLRFFAAIILADGLSFSSAYKEPL